MWRLLKLTFGLVCIFAAAILAARMFAPRGELPFPLNTINTSPDCQLPCWHGITPGVTTRDEVVTIMDADLGIDRMTPLIDTGFLSWQVNNSLGVTQFKLIKHSPHPQPLSTLWRGVIGRL